MALNYQTQVNIQAFTASFTFIPNGQNIAFVIQNSNNNPYFNGSAFSAGAGCEAGFFQGYSQANPPNNMFALELDSYSPLTNNGSFTYSSAQIYSSAPYVQCPCLPDSECGTNNTPTAIDKISTAPVDLTTGSPNTTTGDTYSATVTYDGTNLTLNLYDVTAGGSCPGSNCFTNTWTVDIPSSVDGNTAWVGIVGATGLPSNSPLYVGSLVYNVGTSTSGAPTPRPACSPAFTAPTSGATTSGTVSVSVTPNCNAAATSCGYFVRQYLPDGSQDDTLGASYKLKTQNYPDGTANISAQIYNIGCGSFSGQLSWGTASDSFIMN
jgi:hypothetical protein